MSSNSSKQTEGKPFWGAVDVQHMRVDPCFMTGKGCVYTEVIERSIKERKTYGQYVGFSVMPFRDNLNVFFKNCLSLYFSRNFPNKVSLQRADEVRRPGIIICEGVCKRIQESDFVTVDVSLPNPNVFYELGLAYGIHHKIVVIYHDASSFGKEIAEVLKHLGCRPYAYHDLDPIPREEFDRFQCVWQWTTNEPRRPSNATKVLLYEHIYDPPIAHEQTAMNNEQAARRPEDIALQFSTHVKSAVGLGIVRIKDDLLEERSDQPVIHSYLDIIEGFKDALTVKTDANPQEIQDLVESAYCMIIRTGFKQCHPMAYFWLGYGHARGKNVVPVTVLRDRNESVEDLAFDIRAQRHMFFYEKAPDRFETELTSSLKQMIVSDFADWSRKKLWNHLLGRRGEVSIFTGALHNESFGREMIGDWDLRAASELTSYFARQQYRATIENPVYTPEYPKRDPTAPPDVYVTRLKEMLTDKNCILIASPDVNPLTEVVLGHIYKIDPGRLFSETDEGDIQQNPNAIFVVKEKTATGQQNGETVAKRFFYREIPCQGSGPTRRGFESAQLKNRRIMQTFVSQVDIQQDVFHVFGQIMILPNPFRADAEGPQRYIVVLNGVSGPATFALTHVLTGGVTKEFVAYPQDFDPEAKSEEIVRRLFDLLAQPQASGLDCIVTVSVGKTQEAQRPGMGDISDWRKIRGWELNKEARRNAIQALA
ncbi:MAG TPA: hypothetical protein VFQ13_04495 [Anaerolineales bacterium]|nr:hypothetical protein [Anaerolineales bacterium]